MLCPFSLNFLVSYMGLHVPIYLGPRMFRMQTSLGSRGTSFLVSCPFPLRSWELTASLCFSLFPTAVEGKTPSPAPGVLGHGGATIIWVSTEESGRTGMTDLGFGLQPQELLWGTCEVWWVEFCSGFPEREAAGWWLTPPFSL